MRHPEPDVRRLAGVPDLLRLAPADEYVLAEADPDRVSSVWAGPRGTYGWVMPSRRATGGSHLVVLGPDDAAAGLALGALGVLGSGTPPGGQAVRTVSLPRDADRHLGPAYTLDPRNDWEWRSTRTAPPTQPREADVRWLGEDDHDDIAELLARWSPRHDAVPGRPGVLGWCGVRDGSGRLVATAAHTERRRGVPHLASVATSGDVRGQGLGAAVTAWLTRRLLEDGIRSVALGMYSDNPVARRLYERLGFVCAQELTSGRLVPAG